MTASREEALALVAELRPSLVGWACARGVDRAVWSPPPGGPDVTITIELRSSRGWWATVEAGARGASYPASPGHASSIVWEIIRAANRSNPPSAIDDAGEA